MIKCNIKLEKVIISYFFLLKEIEKCSLEFGVFNFLYIGQFSFAPKSDFRNLVVEGIDTKINFFFGISKNSLGCQVYVLTSGYSLDIWFSWHGL